MGTFEQQAVAQQRLEEIQPAARFAEYQMKKGKAEVEEMPSSPTTPKIKVHTVSRLPAPYFSRDCVGGTGVKEEMIRSCISSTRAGVLPQPFVAGKPYQPRSTACHEVDVTSDPFFKFHPYPHAKLVVPLLDEAK